jgi:hypothetical protein
MDIEWVKMERTVVILQLAIQETVKSQAKWKRTALQLREPAPVLAEGATGGTGPKFASMNIAWTRFVQAMCWLPI